MNDRKKGEMGLGVVESILFIANYILPYAGLAIVALAFIAMAVNFTTNFDGKAKQAMVDYIQRQSGLNAIEMALFVRDITKPAEVGGGVHTLFKQCFYSVHF